MKFTTNRDTMLQAISIAQDVINNKSYVSILSNVLLETAEGKVIVKSTNSQVSIITYFGAEILEEGTTTIFCDKLMSVISSLPPGLVEVYTKDRVVNIKPVEKKVSFKINSLASDKFPIIDRFKVDTAFSIKAKDFKSLIKNCIFAVASDPVRYFLTGCFLCHLDGKLTMVATDGRRMSFSGTEGNYPEVASIIPTKILSMILKFCSDDEDLFMNIDKQSIAIKSNDIEFSSSLIDGQYPKWQKVLPDSLNSSVTVAKKDLEDALKTAGVMLQKDNRIHVFISDGKMELATSPDNELGSATEEISAIYTGEPAELILQASFLSDVIKVINADDIKIEFTANEDKKILRAILIKGSDTSDADYTHVIMPMSC